MRALGALVLYAFYIYMVKVTYRTYFTDSEKLLLYAEGAIWNGYPCGYMKL